MIEQQHLDHANSSHEVSQSDVIDLDLSDHDLTIINEILVRSIKHHTIENSKNTLKCKKSILQAT